MQPGRRDLLVVAAPGAYAFGDRLQMFRVGASGLVRLGGVGTAARASTSARVSMRPTLRPVQGRPSAVAAGPRTRTDPAKEPYTSGGMYGDCPVRPFIIGTRETTAMPAPSPMPARTLRLGAVRGPR
ncbi:hypothetical protein GCM10009646_17350 [Streptomyces aureus]